MKRAPSSTHSQSHSSSTCLSPSFSNDSNNNNFINPEVDVGGYRRGQLSPPSPTPTRDMILLEHASPYSHPGSVESFERVRPLNTNSNHLAIPQMTPMSCSDNAYVLNLSKQTPNVDNGFFVANLGNEPMQEDDYSEPLDFSKPLNLSKHEVSYRLAEDDQGRTWRPW